jgi:glycosyltransferase involved in cell wall biosynthesis
MSAPLITLTMIVKNEEEVLPRALRGWRNLADELVIIDTGSSDHTVEVARAHDANVLAYPWQYPGHKGAARNMGLDAATGEWIVVLDADEIIQQPAALRQAIVSQPDDVAGMNVLFENYHEGRLNLSWYQPRVFRRGLYRYKHREHELPLWCGGDRAHDEAAVQLVFEHRAPAGRDQTKMQPMIDRLLADVTQWPDDPMPAYFLHRQYLLAGDYPKCIQTGHRYLSLAAAAGLDPCEAYGNIASAHHFQGDTQEAIRWLHKAAAEQAHRKIWWLRLAELHMTQGRWQLALAHLRLASELWPIFEWQWEPATNGPLIGELIDKCQAALAASYHVH